MKRFILENIHGILGTLIFHLILIITFLLIKISTIDKSLKDLILVELEEKTIEEKQDIKEVKKIVKHFT